MRRRTAPVLLALFLLAPTLPAQAAQPVVGTGDDAVSSPSVEPTDPGAESSPSEAPDDPVAESVPSAEPTASATPTASADPEPASVPKPSAGTDGDVAEPTATPSAAPSGSPAASRADPSGRWIVMLKPQADVAAVSARQSRTAGVRPQAVFGNLRAYTASLNAAQRRALAADSSVMAVVPDERIELTAQTIPNGIRRISGRSSTMAAIDGVDQRVNADVAIVDTGIDASHPDLNVAGGVNCSTSDRTQWRDVQGHGTHVAGTVAAKDNGYGVVGVAPGARLWAVKILDDTGTGLLSWYVCGLDWIAAQRDPVDSSRPLIEAVNMSVAKWGSDDRNCGLSNNDVLHQAICRVVAKNITVVAAAANDSGSASKRVPAAYDEVITVSALADTDGKPGGLGGPSCWSWGGYDKDDTFADFSNYGSDVDIIAPGKCIWSSLPGNRYGYSSGTSMAAPHVTGAAALYKATRPWATPAEVREALRYLGNSNWITSSDPDGDPEPLLDVARVGAYGTFSLLASTSSVLTNEAGTSRTLPVTLVRSATHFERVLLSVSAPSAIGATIDRTNVYGFGNLAFNLALSVPRSTPGGTYPVVVTATEHGRVQTATVDVVVENDPPKVGAPSMTIVGGSKLGTPTVSLKVSWPAATDPSSAISSYRVERSVDGAAWVGIGSFGPGTRSLATGGAPGHRYQYRVRATDAAGNPSAWAVSPAYTLRAIQDGSLAYSGKWYRASATAAYGGTTRYSVRAGASARAYVTARQVAIVAPMSAKRGKARIYVDGVHVATIDLYRSALSSRRVVWLKTFPTNARRLIEVRVVGTSGRPRVDVDAIIAVGW